MFSLDVTESAIEPQKFFNLSMDKWEGRKSVRVVVGSSTRVQLVEHEEGTFKYTFGTSHGPFDATGIVMNIFPTTGLRFPSLCQSSLSTGRHHN